MDDFTERLIVFALIGVAALVIGSVAEAVRICRNRRNAPNEQTRELLLHEIIGWKGLGYGYSKRFELLRKRGYRKDVADELLAEAEKLRKDQ